MEKQKTAVEWLVEQLTEIDHGCINKTFLQNSKSLAGRKLNDLFTQAKQMEKEQIVEAYKAKFGVGTDPKWKALRQDQAEQYYNETYGKHENKAENND